MGPLNSNERYQGANPQHIPIQYCCARHSIPEFSKISDHGNKTKVNVIKLSDAEERSMQTQLH